MPDKFVKKASILFPFTAASGYRDTGLRLHACPMDLCPLRTANFL